MRALVAYSASSTFVQTTMDYLVSFKKYSGFETQYVHVTNNAIIDFDLNQFDFIFHNYCARFIVDGYVSDSYKEKLKKFTGVKILAVQDEYDRTNILKSSIKEFGFNVVLTCVPQHSLEYVYPKSDFPDVKFITVMTGYVADDFARDHPTPLPLENRPVKIAYRGRDIGGRYGRLGFDKFEIGRRMKEICEQRDISHDIAMDEQSRIYGMAWFEFLGSCRAMLGSESGSNIFDFDGGIEQKYKQMMEANGNQPPSYKEFLPIVAKRDSEIDMGQISPRVFECALMRTPMVLFRGHYSGAIEADQHYIALEKDFSNIDEVLSRLDDFPALEAMTDRAYNHLVSSGQFSYNRFFGMVGEEARKRISGRSAPTSEQRPVASGSFVLRDQHAIELPSDFPDSLEGFKIRSNLIYVNTTLPTIRSMEINLDEFMSNCTKMTNELRDYILQLMYGIESWSGTIKDVSSERQPVTISNEWIFALETIESRKSIWNSVCAKALDRLKDISNGSLIVKSDHEFISEFQNKINERIKEINEHFIIFDKVYYYNRNYIINYYNTEIDTKDKKNRSKLLKERKIITYFSYLLLSFTIKLRLRNDSFFSRMLWKLKRLLEIIKHDGISGVISRLVARTTRR